MNKAGSTAVVTALAIAARTSKESSGSAPASTYSRRFCQNSCQTRRREAKDNVSLRRFENGEHTGGATEVKQATAAGRDVLVVARAGAEEVAELVVASTEPLR